MAMYMATLILFIIIAALFALAFMTRRRFGILGLGLSAGALLAGSLSGSSADLIDAQNISIPGMGSEEIAAVILTLLPSLVLLLSGPRYATLLPAIFGAAAYAVLGTLLLLGPLSSALPADGATQTLLNEVAAIEPVLISATVLIAILDTLSIHGTTHVGRKHDKH